MSFMVSAFIAGLFLSKHDVIVTGRGLTVIDTCGKGILLAPIQ